MGEKADAHYFPLFCAICFLSVYSSNKTELLIPQTSFCKAQTDVFCWIQQCSEERELLPGAHHYLLLEVMHATDLLVWPSMQTFSSALDSII